METVFLTDYILPQVTETLNSMLNLTYYPKNHLNG